MFTEWLHILVSPLARQRLLITCYSAFQSNNTFKLEKKTHLYSFDSSFAEVSLHFNIDLYIANIAEDTKNKNFIYNYAF